MAINDSTQLIFGHSLINHFNTGRADDFTNVPHWLHHLAEEEGNTYAMSGQFGQDHADSLPPTSVWDILDVTQAVALGTVITPAVLLANNYNSSMYSPANFRQEFPADESVAYWDDIVTETVYELYDWLKAGDPSINHFMVYESWGAMQSFTSADMVTTFPTDEELAAYWAYNNGDYHDWWIHLHDVVLSERSDLNTRLLPVGMILGQLLQVGGTLEDVTSAALFDDTAPHGRPTLYFLAALITYMGTYGSKAPASYTVPDNIDSLVVTNYTDVVDEIWTALLNFNTLGGVSRVFFAADGITDNSRLSLRLGLGL